MSVWINSEHDARAVRIYVDHGIFKTEKVGANWVLHLLKNAKIIFTSRGLEKYLY